MTCWDNCRRFEFNNNDNNNKVSVLINEKYSTSYGYHVWPSAPVLAQFIYHNRETFKEKTIIELSSGTGIVGIIGAKVGAHVILSDSHKYPECLELCQQNVNINNVNENIMAIIPLTWGQFDQQFIELPAFDYIIGSDCFYDKKDFEDILSSVSFLIDKHKTKETIFYTTYQERCSDWSIECLLTQWKLKCEYISLDKFDANSDTIGGSDLHSRHSIQLLKISKIESIDYKSE